MRIEELINKDIRVGIYCRTKKTPFEQHSGIELLKADYLRFVEMWGWKMAEFYLDEGRSSESLEKLISECVAGHIDLVVTISTVELNRDFTEVLALADKLSSLAQPVGIYFQQGSVFTLDDYWQQYVSTFIRMAVEESENKSR